MHTTINTAIKALAVAALFAFGTAQAELLDFGTDPDSVAFSRNFAGDVLGNTTFSDEGIFTITQSSAVGSFAFSQWPIITEGLRALTMTVSQGSTVLFATTASSVVPPANGVKAFTFQSFNEVLAAGSYKVVLAGTVRPGGGSYLWGIDANPAAPIPEPSEWLLIGAGLGVVGVVARRKSKPVA